MKQIAMGTLLAAVALFVWGFLFWGLPWPNPAYQHLSAEDEAALRQSLSEHVPTSGAYYVPDMEHGADHAAYLARHREGPLAMVMVRTEGAELMSAGLFAGGFVHMLFSVLLIALLLRAVAPVLRSYRSRVGFLALVGLAAAFWANLGEPIWNYQPWAFHLTAAVYDWTSWIIAGLVLAYVVKPVRAEMTYG